MSSKALPVPAGIYARISDDREGAGLGVARQEADCRQLAERLGWQVGEIFTDNDVGAFSAKTRPAYERLLAGLRNGTVGAVLCWHPDRLTRRPIELEEFITVVEATGAKVATVQAGHFNLSDPTGRMVARIVGSTARYESEHKSARTKRKHLEMAEAGRVTGAGRPFGYEADRKTVRPEEAQLIRQAAHDVLAGASLRGVAEEWNRRGITAVKGGRWTGAVLRTILVSARISGRRELNTVEGRYKLIGPIVSETAEWAPIIDVETSDELRRTLGNPKRRLNARPRAYLLTGGLARCGLCGKPLVAQPTNGERAYFCDKGHGGCARIRCRAEPLEDLVGEYVIQATEGGGLARAMRAQQDSSVGEDLARVEAKLEQLSRDYADDLITRGEWLTQRKRLAERQERLQAQATSAQRTTALRSVPDPLRPAWDTLPLHVRRAVVSMLIDRVVVQPAVRGRPRFDPDRVVIDWRV